MDIKLDYSDVKFKDNGKLKLLIIVGTRPEIIRLAAVIRKCRRYFDCILAHTGQNYDYNLNGVFFRDLKLDDPEVYMDAVGDDLGETVGNLSDSEPYYFDLHDIDEAIVAEEERARLTFELSLLSRIQRECVILYYLQNRSVKEIAACLGIPEGTVKSRLFDARKNVKKGMEEPMENNETKNKRLSYAPADLNMCGCNDIPSHWHFLQDTMVKQILVACAYEGKTIDVKGIVDYFGGDYQIKVFSRNDIIIH